MDLFPTQASIYFDKKVYEPRFYKAITIVLVTHTHPDQTRFSRLEGFFSIYTANKTEN